MRDDEAGARATLVEMQGRISKGPRTALGVPDSSSPHEVRTAFLELTKRFHPARFGRMSPELQRLSNEVFLGIKSAHDTLIRASGSAMRGGIRNGTSGMQVITAESSNRTTGSMPMVQRPSATRPPINVAHAAVSKPPTSPPPSTQTRRVTPATGVPTTSRVPIPGRANTSPLGVPIQGRPVSPSATPPARTSTPPLGMPIVGRTGSSSSPPPRQSAPPATGRAATPTRSPTPPMMPPRPQLDAIDPGTIRHNGVQPVARTAPVFDEREALGRALDLMMARDWSASRQALHALAARVPQSKQYRSLLCYARGREAQVAGRADEALAEFQRALQLDPELAQAKQAITELQRRR